MNDYERGQIDMRERVIVGINGMLEYEQSALAEGLTTQSKSDEIQATLAFLACAIRSLPLTAPATEAGGLGAEGVAQQAKDRIQEVLNGVLQRKEEYFLDDRYCRWGIVQRHLNESVDATVAALAHAAPEPDTLRERVERLAGEIDATANCGPGECNECDSYRHIAAELRALLQPPAGGEGKP